jgi:hypothetical protein
MPVSWMLYVTRYDDDMSKATVPVTKEGQSSSSLNKSTKCELQDHLTEELGRVANYSSTGIYASLRKYRMTRSVGPSYEDENGSH